MDLFEVLRVLVLISHLVLYGEVHCKEKVTCQHFRFVINEDVVGNHILQGHVIRRMTVNNDIQCHSACVDDCLCISMNHYPSARENYFEINDANKDMCPSAMKSEIGANYYDLVRRYTVKDGEKYMEDKHQCVNRCRRLNPCKNGGVCGEICDTKSVRFNCTCPLTHTGQQCDRRKKIIHPKSCRDISQNGNSTIGNYVLYDTSGQAFPVYCAFDVADPEYAWTLIESFSLSNNVDFAFNMEFGFDSPVNNYVLNEVDWTAYRLSLSQMQITADNSMHFRATCNYPTAGLLHVDYAQATLKDNNMITTWDELCKQFEYLNIRGTECYNCTALTKQKPGKAWFINSDKSKQSGCDFDGSQGSVSDENNFGRYRPGTANPDHRCSASPASTTQYWFGGMINP